MEKHQKPAPLIQIEKEKRELSKEELRRLILSGAEEQIASKFEDKNLDIANERSAIVKDRLGNLNLNLIIREVQRYEPTIPKKYYFQIYRLHGWDTSDESLKNRPGIVGKWTNDLIYLRYPAGTLRELQRINPKNENGDRLHKHFQFLTEFAGVKLEEFLNDAIDLMEGCQYWDQFIRRFAKKCGKGYQMSLFEDNAD